MYVSMSMCTSIQCEPQYVMTILGSLWTNQPLLTILFGGSFRCLNMPISATIMTMLSFQQSNMQDSLFSLKVCNDVITNMEVRIYDDCNSTAIILLPDMTLALKVLDYHKTIVWVNPLSTAGLLIPFLIGSHHELFTCSANHYKALKM